MVVDIKFYKLLLLLLLLFPLVNIGKKYNLNFMKKTLISLFRMFIQLFLVGLYLQYIFKLNNLYINIIYLVFMTFIASSTSIKSTKLTKKTFVYIFISMLIPLSFLVFFFNIFLVGAKPIWEAKYLIPISGMVLGNCLKGSIISINHFMNHFRERHDEYLYLLSLGGNRVEVLKPYIKKSIDAVLGPTIADLATIGLVSLPGMMTGQILGGTLPLVAIKYQIAIMILIFAVKIYNLIFLFYLVEKYFFDDFDIIKKDYFL